MVQRRIYTDNTVQEIIGKLEKLGCSIQKDDYCGFSAAKGHIELCARPPDRWMDCLYYQNNSSANASISITDIHWEGNEETQAFCRKGKELYLQVLNGLKTRTVYAPTGKKLPAIHAVSLNSAIDTINENKYAGGKGLNVARALTNLGIHEVYAYTFAGGSNGKELCRLIEEAGVHYEAVEIPDETRITHILQGLPERKQSTQSPAVTDNELVQLIQKIENNISPNDIVVLTGSLPKGVSPRIYATLIVDCHIFGAKAVLDATARQLRLGLLQMPYAVKPNVEEWKTIAGNENLKSFLSKKVYESGIKYAMAMNGREGMLFVSENKCLQAIPPEIIVKSTVGSGDAATAGFIYSQIQSWTDEETARFAVACGTASAEKEGTDLCTLEEALQMKERVQVILPEQG